MLNSGGKSDKFGTRPLNPWSYRCFRKMRPATATAEEVCMTKCIIYGRDYWPEESQNRPGVLDAVQQSYTTQYSLTTDHRVAYLSANFVTKEQSPFVEFHRRWQEKDIPGIKMEAQL